MIVFLFLCFQAPCFISAGDPEPRLPSEKFAFYYQWGPQAVPALIDMMTSRAPSSYHFNNPYLSAIGPEFSIPTGRKTEGLTAAYLVELIYRDHLVKAKLIPEEEISFRDGQLIFQDMDDYLHPVGRIVRRDEQPLSHKDWLAIQKIYRDWWDSKENKTELPPPSLSGTPYRWI